MVRRVPGRSATALAVLLALVLPAFAVAAAAPHSSGPAPGAPEVLGTGCPGVRIADRFPGVVTSYRPFGKAPPVGGLTVTLDYRYQENNTTGLGTTLACRSANVSAVTSASGTFLLRPSVPSGNCTGPNWCFTNSGPFGPYTFHVNRSDPPGDLLRVAWRRDRMELVWTSALGGALVDPPGPLNTSVGDPIRLTAGGITGDGSPSPVNLSYTWLVQGGSWGLVGGGANASVQVESGAAGGSGTAAVEIDGSYNGTPMNPIVARVALAALGTRIETASVSPSVADAGESLQVQLVGDGAVGFRYNASVLPGAGLAAVPLRCGTSAGGATDVVIDCSGPLVYREPGTFTPRVDLTNGYSGANASLPNLTVAPPPALSFTPDPAMGYTGSAIPFQISLNGATGTPPYGPACVATGTGKVECAASGGPTWSIGYAYPRPGRYNAVGSLDDAAGNNETRSDAVTVADLPNLSALSSPVAPLFVGGPALLSANLSGGLWPASYYWNDSLPGGTLAVGTVVRDGRLVLPFVPQVPGIHQVSLVVVDAAGTRVAATQALEVRPGIPVLWQALGGDALPPVPAGQLANVTLRAIDRFGNTVAGFDPPLRLGVVGPSEGATLNVSALGGSVETSDGTGATGVIPSTGWGASGFLNLSLSSWTAGSWSLDLTPAEGAPDLPISISVVVVANARAPHLADPTAARSDPRHAATQWAIEDPYGNPIQSGYIVVRTAFPSGVLDVDEPVAHGKVWVNYTAIGPDAGTVVVLSAYGIELLPAILVPAAAVATLPWDGVSILAGSAIVAGVAVVFAVRGRRKMPLPAPGGDAELERHAAGRDHILRVLAEGTVAPFSALADGWTGPPPRPDRRELVEWLTGLIAEGAIVAQSGPDGRPEFLRSDAAEVRSDLVLDFQALEGALAHRDPPGEAGGEEGMTGP